MNTSEFRGRSFSLGLALVMGVYVLIPLLVLLSVTSGPGYDGWEDLVFGADSITIIGLASVILAVVGAVLVRSSSESRKGFAQGLLVGIVPGVAGGILQIVLISNLAW